MSTTPLPRFTVGDTLPPLTGVCRQDPGTGPVPVDGTTATAQVHLQRPTYVGGTAISRSVTVAADGTWSMAWQTGDLDVAGQWTAEVQLTFPGGGIETFGKTPFTVVPQIA